MNIKAQVKFKSKSGKTSNFSSNTQRIVNPSGKDKCWTNWKLIILFRFIRFDHKVSKPKSGEIWIQRIKSKMCLTEADILDPLSGRQLLNNNFGNFLEREIGLTWAINSWCQSLEDSNTGVSFISSRNLTVFSWLKYKQKWLLFLVKVNISI